MTTDLPEEGQEVFERICFWPIAGKRVEIRHWRDTLAAGQLVRAQVVPEASEARIGLGFGRAGHQGALGGREWSEATTTSKQLDSRVAPACGFASSWLG